MSNKKTDSIYSTYFMQRSKNVSKFTIEMQAVSFNAIDSKGQSYLSVISIFIAMLLGALVLIEVKELSSGKIIFLKISLFVYMSSLFVNAIIFCLATMSRDFKTGITPEGLNKIKNDTKAKIDDEIFQNLYWSAVDNSEVLATKARFLKIAEVILIINFGISIVLGLIYLYIL